MKQEHDFKARIADIVEPSNSDFGDTPEAVQTYIYNLQSVLWDCEEALSAALTAAQGGTKNDWRIIQDWCLDKGLTLVESEAQELANLLDKPPQDGGDDDER